jgi:hypothetical protein
MLVCHFLGEARGPATQTKLAQALGKIFFGDWLVIHDHSFF